MPGLLGVFEGVKNFEEIFPVKIPRKEGLQIPLFYHQLLDSSLWWEDPIKGQMAIHNPGRGPGYKELLQY